MILNSMPSPKLYRYIDIAASSIDTKHRDQVGVVKRRGIGTVARLLSGEKTLICLLYIHDKEPEPARPLRRSLMSFT